LKDKLLENHKIYLERISFYKNFGYDIEKERKFIFEKSQPLYGSILEVGTGKGYFTLELAKERYNFTSVDISKEDQELARQNIKYHGLDKQVDFKIENAEHLSFEDKSYDIIFLINTIHHLAKPFKVVDELVRIVSFEGKIILSDFSKEGFRIMDKTHSHEGRTHESNSITLKDIKGHFLKKEFNVEEYGSRFQEMLIAYQPNI